MKSALIQSAMNAWEKTPKEYRIVPSVPILYFGDFQAFCASRIKIVTVAKNPSSREFPMNAKEGPFSRLPGAEVWATSGCNAQRAGSYVAALNSYFGPNSRPYWQWFEGLDYVLKGFEAGYRHGRRCAALHTDILSPVATYPTFTRLKLDVQRCLKVGGVRIWRELMDELQPDIAIFSIPFKLMQILPFEYKTSWRKAWSFDETANGRPRRKPYVVCRSVFALSSGKLVDAVFGPASQTPFGALSFQDRTLIGKRLKGKLSHW